MKSSTLGVAISFIAIAAACGSHDSGPLVRIALTEPVEECDAYVAAYERCFTVLGPEARKLAEERANGLRAKYRVAADDITARESARSECQRGTRLVQEACR